MLLSAESITKTYGTRVLLDRVSFYLEPGERVGVIGVNGAGKSTLLRILAGAEEPETGCVTRFPNVRLEYLPQNPEFAPGTTVLEQVLLGLSTDARALAEYEAKTILTRLGITRFEQRVEELSGGQRKRVALAAALARPCDVLILDEPTNHLDSEMVTWLEEWLQRFAGGLVMITHDRYFLERVTNRMAEVDGGKLYFYEGSYEDFLRRKAEREESARASERKRQSILRREYQWVMQGPTARGTKSRERLERYEALKNQSGPTERAGLELSSVASRLGKKTVELRGVSKSFEGRQVLRDFDCMLLRDDRIGIVGVNGSGKSTLLNLIAGRLSPDQGEVIVGETVKIGYFSQENPPMDGETRVIDYVKEIGERIETVDGVITASQLLEQFLFPADVQWSPIDKLSGGEKRRLFLLSILASAPNILLLDEPTNDLDIETLTILEDYLETFPGAVVAVSHDRYFLDKVARRIFVVEGDGRVTPYAGGYTDYLAALAERRRAEKKAEKPAPKKEESRPSAPKKLKFSYKEQREYETIDADIAALEEQLADNQAQQSACGSDYVALQRLQEEQSQLESALEEKMERWVYLNDLAERIAAQ
ncbi:ABC-F family ATP-binding cassette domain-containing protein [Pseudoflavonifractor sp. DSM 107456]|uniref:ABC-F family ATP-binding cassette domain-containing protein n=2 Tax=Pseudoflavonifractor TaxID=1017280 RepID=A0ABR9R7M1_9FIRM|nr:MULTISPECIES: ABC-F family ATP-binding cassette domain-containing protein [Pseudoflavonifractor]MBC5730050.1 ABC-F family ATP-binding cassette domain-containing protein [Pseudoflavonifractor hominis]MBE5054583.1 ABC-F family ATP-binding cassette domain-containing protein [Pseudoflavonifractor gallinarum]